MISKPHDGRVILWTIICLCFYAVSIRVAHAASCMTESQMATAERESLSNAAKLLVSNVKSGDLQSLQTNTIPALAADFSGVAATARSLMPVVQQATITIDNVYILDASTEAPGAKSTDFYCGTPVVIVNFNGLPTGMYAFVLLHATGVTEPQQISLVLAKTGSRWMLGGIFSHPMMDAGHNGLWYWTSARSFSQKKMNWDAWFYYRIAANLLDPVDFLTSANLQKLQRETDQVRPENLPGTAPLLLNANGATYQVTGIETTSALGSLDLEVNYNPNAIQVQQLRDPPSARKQVIDIMASILALHPEVHEAFHGIWVHANQGESSLFSLELPMDQIAAVPAPGTVSSTVPK